MPQYIWDNDILGCEAFSEGIPEPIIFGDVIHTRQYEGNKGIRFEVAEGTDTTGIPDWWRDAARFLSALGSEAASVVPLVRERLPLLDTDPSLRRYIEDVFFKRVEEGAPPLRLLLR